MNGKRGKVLIVAIMVLVLAVLACSTEGGGSYSFSTTRSSSGNTGHIEILGDADGSVSSEVEVDEDSGEETVDLDITAGVKEGSYTIEVLDDSSVALTLSVEPGKLAKGRCSVTLNEEGEVEYKISAQEAKGVKIIIDYELR